MTKIKETEIKAWGNSAAIRLSKEVLGALGAKVGDTLDLSFENRTLTVTLRRNHGLEELFADYKGTPESYKVLHEHQDWLEMRPEGEELW